MQLQTYLEDSDLRFKKIIDERHEISEDSIDKSITRDIGSYICPFAGFIKEGCPGCIVHSSNSIENLRDNSFYGEYICNSFHCGANDFLSDEYKNILIKYIDDWLLYSLAILDPESFIWISDIIHEKFCNNGITNITKKKLFEAALKIHYKCISSIEGPIFFYSISEYNLNKNKFSLKSNSNHIQKEREEIITEMKRVISS